jgi:hypothetical protein
MSIAMPPPPKTLSRSRLIEFGSVIAIIAIPIALIAATWEPLEPLPRDGRANAVEQGSSWESAGDNPRIDADSPETRNLRQKKDQGQDGGRRTSAVIATPQP